MISFVREEFLKLDRQERVRLPTVLKDRTDTLTAAMCGFCIQIIRATGKSPFFEFNRQPFFFFEFFSEKLPVLVTNATFKFYRTQKDSVDVSSDDRNAPCYTQKKYLFSHVPCFTTSADSHELIFPPFFLRR